MPLLWYFTAMLARSVLAAASEKPSMAVKRGMAIWRSCKLLEAGLGQIHINYKHTIEYDSSFFYIILYLYIYIYVCVSCHNLITEFATIITCNNILFTRQ